MSRPELRFHNTLSRSLQAFEPLVPGQAGIYTCGPTVYNIAHIGNLRTFLFEDILRRTLRDAGYRVNQVMNLTDVDDKTIRGARERGVPLAKYTQPYKDAFFEDLATLNIEPAEHYPAATEHVAQMIVLIERLFDRGLAYRSDDGSVYYDIGRFPGYGGLSGVRLDDLKPGARVSQDEYEKESLADFALWKAWDEDDGDVGWESPWGRGRPGWHIECSAMSMAYLGETFDIHTGGIDNMFPHHDDEIAQSEGATGKPFVRYWLHAGHLIVDGQKMSKSLGNFYTLRDLTAKGWTGREIRFALLGGQYRQILNFTSESPQAARSALTRIDEMIAKLREREGAGETAPATRQLADGALHRFREAVYDDLNVPGAMGVVFDLLREINRRLDSATLASGDAATLMAAWNEADAILGCLVPAAAGVDGEVERLVEEREAARAARDWAGADALRDRIQALGYQVKDTPEGPRVRRLGE